MWKLIYAIVISLVFLVISYCYSISFEIKEEYFFIIGVVIVPILYIFVYLPLSFFTKKKGYKKRLVVYLISIIVSAVIFTGFYQAC